MRKLIATVALVVAFASNVAAQTINNLGAGAAVSGTDMFPSYQGANPAKRVTAAQINTYIQGLWGAGCATFLTTPSSANLRGCLTDEVGTGAFYTVGGALGTPASGVATNLTGTASGLTAGAVTGGAIQPLSGTSATVSAMTAGAAISDTDLFYAGQSSGTTDRKVTGAQLKTYTQTSAINAQTGTTYTVLNSDQGKLVTFSNGSAIAVTQPDPGGGSFGAGWVTSFRNLGAGTVTVTRGTSSTIDGATSFTLTTGQGVDLYSDGTNYNTQPGAPRIAAVSGLGTGVATAAAVALSGAGGLTTTIASGTSALGTSAISSGACATVVTTAATNTATTDVLIVSFNADPTAVTGYSASANGMLTIINYPTSGNVNHKVCNNTASSITPGAITLNWRVVR